ncbi:MAG: rod shape-determining protein RodA [Candidatus Zipacnadales bacterium]
MPDLRFFRRVDFVLLGVASLLIALGCLMIYSCTRTNLAERGAAEWTVLKTQLRWVVLGLVAMFVLMWVDYTRLPGFHIPIYIITVGLLIVALLMPPVRGTHRWLVFGPIRLQPSELTQLSLIISVACVASVRDQLRDFINLSKTFAWLILPIGLIVLQPDLGTPVVLLGIWLAMMFFIGAPWTYLGGYVSAWVMLFITAWFSGLIEPYQKERLLSFLDPAKDATSSGYQLLQSLIAIGHGGVWGLGLFKGTQTRLHYIPDQQTDFIFTTVAEELGFLGGLFVLTLFGVLLWRCTMTILEAKDTLGRLIAAGVTTMLAIHVIVNIGMTMGLGPVKGMPLPLMSYGGSNMLATMMALGLVQSVHMRRHKIAF